MSAITLLVRNYDDVVKAGTEIYGTYSIPSAAIQSIENYLRGANLDEELAGLVANYGAGEVAGAIVAGSLAVALGSGWAAAAGLVAGTLVGDLASDLAKKVYKDWQDFSFDDFEKDFNDWWKDFEARNNPGGVILPRCYGNNCINSATNTTYRNARVTSSPLVLDLDGDGVEVSQMVTGAATQILFDHNADGVRTGTAWAKADDGMLALDRDGNGTIDSGRELFGNNTLLSSGPQAEDGYAALAELDANGDGQITALDALFSQLRIWRDLDQDGVSNAGELFGLADLGITQIGLGKTAGSQTLADGTRLDGTGNFTIDGQTRNYTDAWFAENAFYRQFNTPVALSDAARNLAGMQGSGMVRDLQEAATLDATLVSDVNGLAGLSRAEMMDKLDALIEHWAATSTMKTSFQKAQDNGYTLVYLPTGMSVDAHFAEPGVLYSAGGGYYSYPEEFLQPLKDKQQRIERLVEILERFNGQTFVEVGANGIKSGAGANYSAGTVSTGSTGGSGGMVLSGGKYVFFTITEPMQYGSLEQSYAQLKESIYGGLVAQTRLKPYLDQITLAIDENGIRLDFAARDAANDMAWRKVA